MLSSFFYQVMYTSEQCIILAYLSGYFSYNRWFMHSLKVYYQVTDSCVLLWVFQRNNKCK